MAADQHHPIIHPPVRPSPDTLHLCTRTSKHGSRGGAIEERQFDKPAPRQRLLSGA